MLQAFGATARDLRLAQHLTQEDLADRTGMHVTYVGGIERGLRNVSLVNLDRLAGGLGVTLASLMTSLDEHRRR